MKKNNTIVIAEAGVNHNGRLDVAKKLIIAAKSAGADVIKFQTYLTEDVVMKSTQKAHYQKKYKPKESQYNMLKNLELSFKEFKFLSRICSNKKIEFLSTGFDIKSIKFLNSINQGRFKIPSGEITNYPLLKAIGKLNKKIILSTGMSKINEIKSALKVLIKSGTKKNKICILHSNSEYPTPFNDANLNAIMTLKKKFDRH